MPPPIPSNEGQTYQPFETGPGDDFFPWIRCRTDVKTDGSRLCSFCQQLDFEALFSISLAAVELQKPKPIATRYTEGILLGSLDEIERKSTACVFCKSVVGLFDRFETGGGLPVEYNGQRVVCYLSNLVRRPGGLALSPPDDKSHRKPFALQLLVTTRPSLVPEPFETSVPPPLLIQKLPETLVPGDDFLGRVVSDFGIDFNVVSQWIGVCTRTRGNERATATSKATLRITLIVVEREALVEPIKTTEYIALSYVWGQIKPFTLTEGNAPELHLPGRLSPDNAEIPQTIHNTMLIYQKLRERFLWIDTHGTDAGASFPRVREQLRSALQHIVEVRRMRLAHVLPGLENSVDSTFWNTRAWTYQERLLSPRRLYFTENQVFFECSHGECREDMSIDAHSMPIPREATHGTLIGMSNSTSYNIVSHKTLNLDVYDDILSQYSSRSLSYEEDILNAFQGVINILRRDLFNDRTFVVGVPLCLLDVSLLWRPAGLLRHRHRGFPSWSWTGWVGCVETNWSFNVSERTISRVVWLKADSSLPIGREWTGRPDVSWSQWDLWEHHFDKMQTVHYTKRGGDPDRWFCHPIPDQVDSENSPLDVESGRLHLRAEVAQLAVTKTHSPRYWAQGPKCEEGIHEKCELSIFDSNGSHCGVLYMDGNTLGGLQPGLHDFIKLSQSTLAHADSDSAWDDDTGCYSGEPGGPPIKPQPPLYAEDEIFDQARYDLNIPWCLYNVLMIERRDGIAYRMGVGQVHIHSFDEASPKWQKILLG